MKPVGTSKRPRQIQLLVVEGRYDFDYFNYPGHLSVVSLERSAYN